MALFLTWTAPVGRRGGRTSGAARIFKDTAGRDAPATKEEYAGVMGLGMDDLAEKLFPYLSYERRMQVFLTRGIFQKFWKM